MQGNKPSKDYCSSSCRKLRTNTEEDQWQILLLKAQHCCIISLPLNVSLQKPREKQPQAKHKQSTHYYQINTSQLEAKVNHFKMGAGISTPCPRPTSYLPGAKCYRQKSSYPANRAAESQTHNGMPKGSLKEKLDLLVQDRDLLRERLKEVKTPDDSIYRHNMVLEKV
ncbi:hypothetical protein AOLI_G00318010 [Acnodon oligacanthus]